MDFKKILIPYDNSENSKRALKEALKLANLSKGEITIVHVISYHKAIAKIVEQYEETVIQHVKKFIDSIKSEASKQNIPIKEEILYGNPSEEILDLIKKKTFDLIMIGRRGTTKLTGPSLGSVSNALVQNSKIPVMVVM